MAATSCSSSCHSWPDFPPELLGLVLSRLPSHADRVRLRAVCLPWRSSALPLPPLLPWLALCDGTFLSLPDGAVHRMPVANDVSARISVGSAVFLVHGDETCSLMDPSRGSGTTTPVPELAVWFSSKPVVRKVVVSDRLVAALVKFKRPKNKTSLRVDNIYQKVKSSTKVIVSTRGLQGDCTRCSTEEWDTPVDSSIRDIALFKEKLYVLTMELEQGDHELHVLDTGRQQTSRIAIRSIPMPTGYAWFDAYSTECYVQRNYLVGSGDRLLMVERRIYQPPMFPIDSGIEERTRLFKVFEAADLGSGPGKWTEVDTLMGHALFVSEGCSESLPAVGKCSGIGVRQGCIYFMTNYDKHYRDMFDNKIFENPLLDSGVYNMRDQTIMPLLSEMVVTPVAGDQSRAGKIRGPVRNFKMGPSLIFVKI